MFHSDGTLADGPALSEVQGYAHAAWQAGALLADALGYRDHADAWSRRAAT